MRLYRGRKFYQRNLRALRRAGASEKQANALAAVYSTKPPRAKRTPRLPVIQGIGY